MSVAVGRQIKNNEHRHHGTGLNCSCLEEGKRYFSFIAVGGLGAMVPTYCWLCVTGINTPYLLILAT